MQNFEFYSPTKIFFGKQQEKKIADIIKNYGFNKVLIVIGEGSVKGSGLYDVVVSSLNDSSIEIKVLEGVEPNPKVSMVRKGVSIAKEFNPELVLGVGGGSVIDTAKAIACGYYLNDDPWKLNEQTIKPLKALPIGVILTHSAAGSELSNSCVISNEDTNVKSGFNSDIIRPLFAVLNPELTYTVSKYQTACGIVDIIMHTLERFLTDVDDLYFEEEVALGLIKSVIKAGRIALDDPLNYDARASLMIASSFSHNGLTGLGGKFYFTVHKLEHEVSGRYDYIPHAAGLSILYYGWAMEVYKELPHKFAMFARRVFDINDNDDLSCSLQGINCLRAFFKEINMPTTFKEVDVNEEDIPLMAQRITKNNTYFVPGFVELDLNKVTNILKCVK